MCVVSLRQEVGGFVYRTSGHRGLNRRLISHAAPERPQGTTATSQDTIGVSKSGWTCFTFFYLKRANGLNAMYSFSKYRCSVKNVLTNRHQTLIEMPSALRRL